MFSFSVKANANTRACSNFSCRLTKASNAPLSSQCHSTSTSATYVHTWQGTVVGCPLGCCISFCYCKRRSSEHSLILDPSRGSHQPDSWYFHESDTVCPYILADNCIKNVLTAICSYNPSVLLSSFLKCLILKMPKQTHCLILLHWQILCTLC